MDKVTVLEHEIISLKAKNEELNYISHELLSEMKKWKSDKLS